MEAKEKKKQQKREERQAKRAAKAKARGQSGAPAHKRARPSEHDTPQGVGGDSRERPPLVQADEDPAYTQPTAAAIPAAPRVGSGPTPSTLVSRATVRGGETAPGSKQAT